MPNIDLSILNQRQTPAFYADVFANRPAAGYVGRIFVSTDTFAFYRDNGTGWDLIGGPGTGTVTGSGASGQIALWSGASTIVGDTGLTYDGTANSLTASKFIVTGGTSSQFLKADGSVDSSSYVPYTGATASLNMGANNILAQNYLINGNNVNSGGYLGIKQFSGSSSGQLGYTSISALTQNSLYFQFSQTNGTNKTFELSAGLLGTSTVRQFQLPDADGTIALTSNIPSVSGAAGQVSYFNGTNSITGSNDLFWDSVNGHLGVNTNVPGTALDVHHDQPTVAILNQTVATNDVRIGFQNNGVGLWRIGAFYNAGANDFGIYDAVAALQPVTVKKTTGQVLIGTSTVGSGKLVVASNIGDNGIQIVGASAPSLRIDSAESGPTKRAGLGISTATNNFIQGSADRDFCIFNGSTAAASPILFGIYDAGAANVQEAARISPARNFIVGTSVDSGNRFQVSGTGYIFNLKDGGTSRIAGTIGNTSGGLDFGLEGSSGNQLFTGMGAYEGGIGTSNARSFNLATNGVVRMQINTSGNLGLGITPNTWTGTNVKAFQFGNTGALGNSGTFGTILFNNSYYDGGYKYISSNPASAYVQDGSTHNFYTANAGTAGAGISFANSMSLTSTGGSQARLSLLYNFYIDNDQSPEIVSYVATSGTSVQRWLQGSTPTETMRLSTSKNLLIGTTTDDGTKLQVKGNVKFGAGSGNRAILDSNDSVVTLAPGGTTDFDNFSGMLLVCNHNTGAFQIFVCGGGSTASVYLLGGAMGTFTYNLGINGYTFTNNTGSTYIYNLTAFRTRNNA